MTMTTTDVTAKYITGWMLDEGFRVEHESDPTSPYITTFEGVLTLFAPDGTQLLRVPLCNVGALRARIDEIAHYND